MSAAVEVHQLSKTYPGGVVAVRDVDFEVHNGEVFGLLGPNGAGKSTTIGMLTTTVNPTTGWALVGGYDVARRPLDARRVSSVVFQDPVVDPSLTGRRNLETHARLWGVEPADVGSRIAETADGFGLDDLLDRPVASYSGGQSRRLEIVRALLSQPRVLFLDEPTVGLDPRIRYELLDLVARLRDRGRMTIILTTHYLDEAERLCDRVAIVHEGRVVALDAPVALLDQLGHEVVEIRVTGDASDATDMLATLRAHGLAGDEAFTLGSTLLLPVPTATRARGTVTAIADLNLATAAVTSRRPTLDDVYLRLTGSRIAA